MPLHTASDTQSHVNASIGAPSRDGVSKVFIDVAVSVDVCDSSNRSAPLTRLLVDLGDAGLAQSRRWPTERAGRSGAGNGRPHTQTHVTRSASAAASPRTLGPSPATATILTHKHR